MRLCIVMLLCIVCIHQVRSGEEYITGYSGQSVVLKSGVDRSWNLTRVQWSIYTNTTYIAGIKDGELVNYKFWRHQGRLELDRETGDLTILNVTVDDSMTYNVLLVALNDMRKEHKVHLTVQESLKTPDIHSQMFHSLNDSQCFAVLVCNASKQNVNLSWTIDGEFNGSYISGTQNYVDSSLVLFASFSSKRNVTFNCTASKDQQTVTRQKTVGCSEEKQKLEVCAVCTSCTSSVILSIVLTAVGVILVYLCTQHKDRIKDASPERLRHFISSICTTSFSPRSNGHVQRKEDTA